MRVVGEQWSAGSQRLRDALTRNTIPMGFYAIESDEGRRLLDEYKLDLERLPAVILHNNSVLYSPTLVEVAEAIGVHETPSQELYDVAIVGAGPAGLAAGVYGASEGLQTMLIESESIGGQAGSSSLIRNLGPRPGGRRVLAGGGDATGLIATDCCIIGSSCDDATLSKDHEWQIADRSRARSAARIALKRAA